MTDEKQMAEITERLDRLHEELRHAHETVLLMRTDLLHRFKAILGGPGSGLDRAEGSPDRLHVESGSFKELGAKFDEVHEHFAEGMAELLRLAEERGLLSRRDR